LDHLLFGPNPIVGADRSSSGSSIEELQRVSRRFKLEEALDKLEKACIEREMENHKRFKSHTGAYGGVQGIWNDPANFLTHYILNVFLLT
jgi:hypothetical protein